MKPRCASALVLSLCLASLLAAAAPGPPDTPAGKRIQALLQAFDAGTFESSLREVLDAQPGALPEAELLNRIARVKAEALLARTEEIFE